MTKNQFKKKISAYTHEDLIEFLLSTFDSSKAFRDVMSVSLNPADKDKIITTYKKKLEKAFYSRSFSMSECKAIVAEFTSVCPDMKAIAMFWIFFATTAADLSGSYGDFGTKFYDAIYDAGVKGIDYVKKNPECCGEFFSPIEEMIEACGQFGYGVQDDLETAYQELIDILCDQGFLTER